MQPHYIPLEPPKQPTLIYILKIIADVNPSLHRFAAKIAVYIMIIAFFSRAVNGIISKKRSGAHPDRNVTVYFSPFFITMLCVNENVPLMRAMGEGFHSCGGAGLMPSRSRCGA